MPHSSTWHWSDIFWSSRGVVSVFLIKVYSSWEALVLFLSSPHTHFTIWSVFEATAMHTHAHARSTLCIDVILYKRTSTQSKKCFFFFWPAQHHQDNKSGWIQHVFGATVVWNGFRWGALQIFGVTPSALFLFPLFNESPAQLFIYIKCMWKGSQADWV